MKKIKKNIENVAMLWISHAHATTLHILCTQKKREEIFQIEFIINFTF